LQVDVKLSVRGNPRGRGTEAHHQREQIVEVTVYTLRHGVVRVEEQEEDLYAAVDLVSDKLRRKMVKVKERAVQKANWPGRGGPKGGDTISQHLGEEVVDRLPTDQLAPPVPELVREKVLEVSDMSLDDAMEQIENVGHDFFLFKDSADGSLKVLYRRRSHGYGVIIPVA
jgi:ribosomal subunit interface protein